MKTISIDIGGTFTKWAVLDENLNIIKKGKFKTEALERKAEGIMKETASFINELVKEFPDVKAAGISVPGAIDSDNGVVVLATKNIPGSQDMNLGEEIGKYTKLPVKFINDANAAALGEKAVGSLKDAKNAVLITLGTGIGAGIIINGEIYQGSAYASGEVGRHYVGAERWEDQYSTRTLINNVNLMTGVTDLTGEKILKLYDENTDKTVREQVDLWIYGVAQGVSNIINIVNPDTIALGGGISENSLVSEGLITEKLKDFVRPQILNKTKIVKAVTGNDAALYGVALFCRSQLNIK